MKRFSVTPDVKQHMVVCGNENTFCAHPVEAGEIFNFGNGEIAFMHLHSECEYSENANLRHGQTGVHNWAKVLLTRSMDGGLTWPESGHTVVFDQGLSIEEQRKILGNTATSQNTPPMTKNTVFHFGKSFSGEEIGPGRHQIVPYIVRSEDKGHTWSKEVTIPLNNAYTFYQSSGAGFIRQGGRLLKQMVVSPTPGADNCTPHSFAYNVLYCSEDNGITWQFISEIARDPNGENNHSYASLIDLGGGRLMAASGAWRLRDSRTRWISTCFSDDNGLNWSEPKTIQSFGTAPNSLLLKDGRILILYARRFPAVTRGIYGIASCDGGMTWSNEFTLRNGDASGPDIGYPVAIQLDNGDVFTGYYYMVEDGLPMSGKRRHVAGTIFSI